ncbi:hypothetical protein C7C46_14075 [Streptomyces tateyamensis]|uniref:Acyl-CoA oxidase C-alpha1 domain-containing protein n=1 Tax=Streptomyces tateyamensis TaxID=565073 RepID=A0A2V4NSQ0_9ACTN|nr:hypothetical protein [Streptomyces tateyamensis]PYC79489.1 hypothetical protein C7C46_14075 [Streptomyces tateyamensis]
MSTPPHTPGVLARLRTRLSSSQVTAINTLLTEYQPWSSTGTSAHRRLARLAAALPPAAEVFGDPELLAALGEATVLADPALYQTFLSHYVLCVGSLVLLDGKAADPDGGLAHARTKGSFMVTEVGEASSHLAIRTEARFDPVRREFSLHTPDARAAKFSSVAAPGLPQQAVVCARLLTAGQDGGVFSFLVDITGSDGLPVPGVSVSALMPVAALPLPYGLVRFDGARVGYERWLADGAVLDTGGGLHDPQPGPDARLQRTLGCGQALWATLPAAMAALAGRSAAMAWRFNAGRRSHGRLAPGLPVLAYRTQQHAVLGALATAHSLRCTARAALAAWTDPPAAAPGQAAMTFSPWAAVDHSLALFKAHTTRAAAELVDDLQHRCGVSGFVDRNRLAGYLGFARAFDNAGGDNTLILLDAGRAIAAERARDPQPPGPPPEVPADPTEARWWPAAAALLEAGLAERLAATVRAREAAGHRDLELWNPLLADLLELGDLRARRLAAAAARAGCGWPVPHAADLAALDGLRQARRLAGPLLAARVLTPATVRGLPAAMDAVCDRLGPAAADLAAALDPGPDPARTAFDAPDYATALLAAHQLADDWSTS